jgi:hypothetical protein
MDDPALSTTRPAGTAPTRRPGRPASRRRTIEEHVSAAVHSFLGPGWVVLLAARVTRAGRREFRRRLTGPVDLRPGGTAHAVDGLAEEELLRLLLERGAPDECVLVKDGLLEDEVADLSSAVHRVLLTREGALVSCLPGRLCLLQCERGRTRLVLGAPDTTDREDGMDHAEHRR